mmetsp:Transcript_19270/g.46547  ORF Transcript_19270/g.46547 Transcript_19270/m.46547 type:complete len:210 (-) Transcript_19270:444-1073(-)
MMSVFADETRSAPLGENAREATASECPVKSWNVPSSKSTTLTRRSAVPRVMRYPLGEIDSDIATWSMVASERSTRLSSRLKNTKPLPTASPQHTTHDGWEGEKAARRVPECGNACRTTSSERPDVMSNLKTARFPSDVVASHVSDWSGAHCREHTPNPSGVIADTSRTWPEATLMHLTAPSSVPQNMYSAPPVYASVVTACPATPSPKL